ncbi:MAG: hypothetical protein OXC91_00990, partial [Rhodobacteraceae bacterium]|nr:hypothetical protein [Paracoccaceae bacterium]
QDNTTVVLYRHKPGASSAGLKASQWSMMEKAHAKRSDTRLIWVLAGVIAALVAMAWVVSMSGEEPAEPPPEAQAEPDPAGAAPREVRPVEGAVRDGAISSEGEEGERAIQVPDQPEDVAPDDETDRAQEGNAEGESGPGGADTPERTRPEGDANGLTPGTVPDGHAAPSGNEEAVPEDAEKGERGTGSEQGGLTRPEGAQGLRRV